MNNKETIQKALLKLKSNQPLEAIDIINKTSNNEINNPDLLLIKGLSNSKLKKYNVALADFKKIISIDSNYVDAYFNIAVIYKERKNYHEALKYLDILTFIDKKNFKAFSNKCFIKIILRDFNDALNDANLAIKLNDQYLNAYLQRGNIYKELKIFDKSEDDYNHIIKLAQKDSLIYYEACFNLSQLLLLNGSFKKGFELYEHRIHLEDYNSIRVKETGKKILTLDNIKNKIVIVLGEQGIGDNIQFSRYLKFLKNKCLKVFFCVDKKMKPFFKKMNIADRIYSPEDKIDFFDYYINLMSLPLLFQTDSHNIPNIDFKIKADIDKSDEWSKKIKPYQDFFKIGIKTTANKHIVGRNFSLNIFENLSKFKKIRLFSLEKEIDKENISDIKILKFDNFDEIELFKDSKALIENLDLVITCDTSIAHLSASMNKPTWIILNDVADWRWLNKTKKSLWYENVSLFRCEKKDKWLEPILQIEELLKEYK